MPKPEIFIIAALTEDRLLGFNDRMPWSPRHDLPSDMHWFVKHTTENIVLMGRRTYESIGEPLPNRINYVLSNDPVFAQRTSKLCGVHVFTSYEEAIAAAEDQRIFVIGGGMVYARALSSQKHPPDKMLLTLVRPKESIVRQIDKVHRKKLVYFPAYDMALWEPEYVEDEFTVHGHDTMKTRRVCLRRRVYECANAE